MADELTPEQAARKAELAKLEAENATTNASRSGVGTRLMAGMTRGKASSVISWEAFDESLPATLPKSITEFMDVTKVQDEASLVGYLITGYNDANYKLASDEIGEYVDPTWTKDQQAQFRLVVRNYSKGAGVSIEDAANLIKPGFSKAVSK
jgi:hypothetical protein